MPPNAIRAHSGDLEPLMKSEYHHPNLPPEPQKPYIKPQNTIGMRFWGGVDKIRISPPIQTPPGSAFHGIDIFRISPSNTSRCALLWTIDKIGISASKSTPQNLQKYLFHNIDIVRISLYNQLLTAGFLD